MPGSATTPSRTDTRNNAPVRFAFRAFENVGARDYQVYAARWLAYALPCRRFAVILADANARLGANADCYSFIAVDLHHLLFAGFYRRTESLDLCALRCPQHVEHETLRGWVARTLGDCLDHNAFKSGEVAKFGSHVIPVSQRTTPHPCEIA